MRLILFFVVSVALSFGLRAAPPNVVFFLVDDLGWRDVGCFGSSFYETPNINRLAREGVKFSKAYAACPRARVFSPANIPRGCN